jgi:hypothetical protein
MRIEIRQDGRGNIECYRNGRRVDCESIRSERDRALESSRAARERAADARRYADDARRRADEIRQRELDRVQEIRRDAELSRLRAARQRRSYDYRPRVSLGGGADMRRFNDVNRYLASAGVDFHGSDGLGMRPEVVYGWTDRQSEPLQTIVCPACTTLPTQAPAELRSRSRLLGVNLNATYTMLRGSFARPYLLGGVGVLTTREVVPVVSGVQPLNGNPQISQVTYRSESHDHADLGLNAGAGLEFGRGPVRLFTEFRYFLTDTPTARGFSGMLPIAAGVRF